MKSVLPRIRVKHYFPSCFIQFTEIERTGVEAFLSSVILVIYRLYDVESLLEEYLLIIYQLLKILTGERVSGNDKVGSGEKFLVRIQDLNRVE